MKAAIYRQYGTPDVVQIADVPTPDIKSTEMLVKVRATTVTAVDSRLRSARVPRGFAVLMRLGFGIRGPRKPINGASGAVGSAAVQLAKHLGAVVTLTLTSTRDARRATSC